MDVFTLAGKITIDIQNALSNIESVILKVQELEALLNGTQTTTQTTTQQTGDVVEKATEDATKKTGNTLNKWSVMMGNLATQAANKVYNAGKSFLQTGYEFNASMELWREQLKNMLGLDLEGADAFLDKLHQFAIETPYSMEEVMSNAIVLLGNQNVRENTDIIDLLTMIGNMSNGDNSAFGSLARGVMQVFSKGKVHAEEANQQFAERGVDVWQLLADYYNTTGRDGYTDWTSGDVMKLSQINPDLMATASEFYEALKYANFSEGGFYAGRMDAMMNTAVGQAERMQDAYKMAAGAFTDGIFETFATETIPAISDILEKLDKWATENPEALKNLGEAFSSFATGGLDVLLSSLQTLLGWWNENSASFDAMLVLLGGLAIYAGHPAAGTALIAAGAGDAYTEAKKQIEEGSPVGQQLMIESPAAVEAEKNGTGDELGFIDWVNYNIGAPFVQFLHNLFPALQVDPDDPSVYGLPSDSGFTTRDEVGLGTGADGTSGSKNMNPLAASMQSIVAQIRSEVAAGAQEGVASGISDITITGNVTTGDVTLDTGAIVGQIAPKMNLVLGGLNAMSSRG